MSKTFKYHIDLGIIDLFYGTMSKQELNESYDSYTGCGSSDHDIDFLSLNEKEEYIVKTITSEQGETPRRICFFVIPDFETLEMSVCALAKISNNGTTTLFTNDKDLYDMYIKRDRH